MDYFRAVEAAIYEESGFQVGVRDRRKSASVCCLFAHKSPDIT